MVEVRRGSLGSRGCCSGPAGTTAITSLQLRSGADHSDPGLAGSGTAIRSGGDCCVAAEVRRRRRRGRRGGGGT